jgi:hypothetical protein
MSNEMLNLINQAKAQAKRDAFFSLIGKNSKIVVRILLVLIAVGVVAIGVGAYKKANQEKFSEIFHRALIDQQAGESEKSIKAFKEIVESSSAPNGIKALAGLRYGAILLNENKTSEALKIYEEIADCRSCDDYVSDLAKLLIARIWLSDNEEVKKEDLASRIKKLEQSASVLKYQIAEQRAFLEMQKGNKEEAKKIFSEIEKGAEKQPALKSRAADGIKMLEE